MSTKLPDSGIIVGYRLPNGTSEADNRVGVVIAIDSDTKLNTINVGCLPGDFVGDPVWKQIAGVEMATNEDIVGKCWSIM